MKEQQLRAGPLTLKFNPENAVLWDARLSEHELVHQIYGAIRDQDWNTILNQMDIVDTKVSDDEFAVSFLTNCRRGGNPLYVARSSGT